MSSGKKTQGRQKVEMKKMTNESNMQVTFSKRRSGLFKKVSELCTLCGADIALVIFSPGEKVYSFGHPDVDTVIDRYLSRVPHQNNGTIGFIEAQRNANVCELNSRLTLINNMLDVEKKRMDELSQIHNMTEAQYWWVRPFDGMNWDQLNFLKNQFENLKNLIAQHPNRYAIQGAPTQIPPFFVGNGSFSNMPVHQQPQQAQMFQPFFYENGSSSNMPVRHQINPHQSQILPPFSYGIGSSSNMSLNHQPTPPQAQNFSPQFFENPMLQPHLFGFNNMGGGRGGAGGVGGGGEYGPSRFS